MVNLGHHAQQTGQALDRAALARDFAQAVSDELVPRAMKAARIAGRSVIAAAGGVAANSVIRADLERRVPGRAVSCICRPCGCAVIMAP